MTIPARAAHELPARTAPARPRAPLPLPQRCEERGAPPWEPRASLGPGSSVTAAVSRVKTV